MIFNFIIDVVDVMYERPKMSMLDPRREGVSLIHRECYAQERRRRPRDVRGTRYRPGIGVAQAIARRSRDLPCDPDNSCPLCLAAPKRVVDC
jgi:hypothetical protein